jgi:ribosomal protein L37E
MGIFPPIDGLCQDCGKHEYVTLENMLWRCGHCAFPHITKRHEREYREWALSDEAVLRRQVLLLRNALAQVEAVADKALEASMGSPPNSEEPK